jgi:beta-lactamase regulating signal transducer with metallopeptidase domain
MTAIILEAALRGLVFAAAVGLGLSALRVRNVPARKAAWSLVLLASLAMPLVMRAFPQRLGWTLPIRFAPRVATPVLAPAAILVPSIPARTESRAASAVPTTFDLAPVTDEPIAAAPRSIHWPPVTQMLIGLYLAVTIALLIRLLYGLAVAIRLWTTALPVSPLIAPDPHVRVSSKIPSPVTIGSGIVLPAEYTQWDMRKLRMVLAHERSHVRQLDFYLQLLAGLYTAFFWFSPLGWWLRRILSSLGEAIGDRAGIDAAASRTGYAQIVLEFAAMPHKSLPGVAMARSGNLTRRVESMLNEHLFRTSFAEGRRRALASLLLIPAALIAVSLTRVPSASAQSAPPPPPPATAPSAPSAPDPAAAPTVAPADAPEPPAPATPEAPTVAPVAPAIPPAPADGVGVGEGTGEGQSSSTDSTRTVTNGHSSNGYSYHYDTNGDSYAVVRGSDQNLTFSGDWTPDRKNQIDQARRMTNGPFLWFTHDGKSYIVTDPAIVARIESMYAPMELLGKQQEELGRQQEALGKKQEALGHRQEFDVTVRLPDLSKELAELDAAAASARVEQDHIDVKQLADIEAKIKLEQDQLLTPEKMAELQERLAKIQEEWTPEKIAALQEKVANLQERLGDLQGQAGEKQGLLGEQMGKLGEEQGKLGEKQGVLGEQQGKLAEDLDRQVHSIIQQTLQSGTAKPVQ